MHTDPQASPDQPDDTGRLWQAAASYAARVHAHQTRRDGATPYAAHTFRVAITARHLFECEDEVVLAAALLHDTIEDTGTDYDDLAEQFGQDVADCVAALTKNMALPEDAREAEYDQRLATAGWRPILIKLADVFDNLSDTHHEHARRPKRGADDKLRRVVKKAQRAITLAESHLNQSTYTPGRDALSAGIRHVESKMAAVSEQGREPPS